MTPKYVLTSAMVAAMAIFSVSGQIQVPNNGFEVPDKGASTGVSNLQTESGDFSCSPDKHTPYRGTYSLKISSKTEGNHFFNEEFPFSTDGLKKYRLKCAYRTQDLQGGLKLGARVFDEQGTTISLIQFPLTRNKNIEWTTGTGVFISEPGAAKLRIFGNLEGTGDVWLDEITIEEMPPPQKYPSPEVALYVHEFFDLIYQNSIIEDRWYIADLKSKTMYLCADSIDKTECYNVLKGYAIKGLRDGHSFFSTPEEWKAMTEGGKHPLSGASLHNYPSGRMLKENIAYITLPMFVSNEPELMAQYADSIQSMLARFDRQNPKGYIVDLSNNGGGNCFPMIAGLGPLVGNGVCELSYSGDGSVSEIIYREGWTGRDTSLVFQKLDPYHLKNKNKPVAVIYGKGTGSSGEVAAISFIGLAYAKSFGQATAGCTTRIDNFEMSDGAYLNLASGVAADRNGNKFRGPISPDVETKDWESAITEAIKWILGTD